MYLGSFLVNELVVVIAGRDEQGQQEQTQPQTGEQSQDRNQRTEEANHGQRSVRGVQLIKAWMMHQDFLGLLAMSLQAWLSHWAFAVGSFEALKGGVAPDLTKRLMKTISLILVSFYVASISWLYVFVVFSVRLLFYLLVQRKPVSVTQNQFCSLITIPLSLWQVCYLWGLLGLREMLGLLGLAGFILAHMLLFCLFGRYWRSLHVEAMVFPFRYFFPLANLLAALIYYRFRYNPSGTVKPRWTDIFG